MPGRVHPFTHRVLLFLALLIMLPPVTLAMQPTDAKSPVPDKAAQQEAREVINELFGSEYEKAKTSAQKLALAQKLLQEAARSKDDSAGYFVLLRVANDVAVQAGDVEVAFRAIEETAKTFQVDTVELKTRSFLKAAKAARLGTQHRRTAKHAVSLIEEAMAEDNYQVAAQVADAAMAAARKSRQTSLAKQISELERKINEAEKGFVEVRKALERLDVRPGDPEANLLVGRFYCLTKDNWERGVPMLALGSDPELKAVAIKELKGATSPERQAKLGDDWWKLAEKEEGLWKTRLQSHALHWYEQALPQLTGLSKIRVEKRFRSAGRDATSTPSGHAAPFDSDPAARRAESPAGPIAAVWELNFGGMNRSEFWRVTLYGNGTADGPKGEKTWSQSGTDLKIGQWLLHMQADGRSAKGRQAGGGPMLGRLLSRNVDFDLGPLPKRASLFVQDEPAGDNDPPKRSARKTTTAGTFELTGTVNNQDRGLFLTLDLREGGDVCDHGRKIGTWSVKGSKMRIARDYQGAEEIALRKKSIDKFAGRTRWENGEAWVWSLDRAVPVAVWDLTIGESTTRRTFYSNGRIDAPHAVSGIGYWWARPTGLQIGEAECKFSPDGRSFSGRFYGGGGLEGTLASGQ